MASTTPVSVSALRGAPEAGCATGAGRRRPVLGSTSTYWPAALKNQVLPSGPVNAAWNRSQSGSRSPSPPSTGTRSTSTGGSGAGLQRKLPPL